MYNTYYRLVCRLVTQIPDSRSSYYCFPNWGAIHSTPDGTIESASAEWKYHIDYISPRVHLPTNLANCCILARVSFITHPDCHTHCVKYLDCHTNNPLCEVFGEIYPSCTKALEITDLLQYPKLLDSDPTQRVTSIVKCRHLPYLPGSNPIPRCPIVTPSFPLVKICFNEIFSLFNSNAFICWSVSKLAAYGR